MTNLSETDRANIARDLIFMADRLTSRQSDASVCAGLTALGAAARILTGTRPDHFSHDVILDVQDAFNLLVPTPEISNRELLEGVETLVSLKGVVFSDFYAFLPDWIAEVDEICRLVEDHLVGYRQHVLKIVRQNIAEWCDI